MGTVRSLADLKGLINGNPDALQVEIVALKPQHALLMSDFASELGASHGWRVRGRDRAHLLSYLDRSLMAIEGVSIPRVAIDIGDRRATEELRRRAHNLLLRASSIGGSVWAPIEGLRNNLFELAAEAESVYEAGGNREGILNRLLDARAAIDELRSMVVCFNEPPLQAYEQPAYPAALPYVCHVVRGPPINSLQDLEQLIENTEGAWLIAVASLELRHAAAMAEYVSVLKMSHGWEIQRGNLVVGMACLDRQLVLMDDVLIPRIMLNTRSRNAISKLRECADRALHLACRIGGSVVGMIVELHKYIRALTDKADQVRASHGSDAEIVNPLLEAYREMEVMDALSEAQGEIGVLRLRVVHLDVLPDPRGEPFYLRHYR